MVWTTLIRALAVAAAGWAVWLLGASPTLTLEIDTSAVEATLAVHCDAVLQSGDRIVGVDGDGSVLDRRWRVDSTERAVVERRLRDTADPVPSPTGVGVVQPDVELDEAAISASCDGLRSYRTGWSLLLGALAAGLLVLGRRQARARAETA